MIGYDHINAVTLILLVALMGLAYGLRLVLKGPVHFDRVDSQGGSLLLGKGLMEMAYWALQPAGRLLVRLHITPNKISWASLVLGGIAGSFLVYGKFGSAALCATVSAFLDCLDGMVARMTGGTSEAGKVLDSAIDRYAEFFYLGGLVLYYREYPYLLVLALMALAGSFMVSYSTAKAEAMHMPPPPGIMRRAERAFYLILGAALSALPVPGLDHPLGLPMVFAMGLVAILSNISAIERLYTIARDTRLLEITEEQPQGADADHAPVPSVTLPSPSK